MGFVYRIRMDHLALKLSGVILARFERVVHVTHFYKWDQQEQCVCRKIKKRQNGFRLQDSGGPFGLKTFWCYSCAFRRLNFITRTNRSSEYAVCLGSGFPNSKVYSTLGTGNFLITKNVWLSIYLSIESPYKQLTWSIYVYFIRANMFHIQTKYSKRIL